MNRILIAIVALAVCAWWFRPRRASTTSPDVAQSERVLADLAAYGGGIRWFNDRQLAEQGVAFWTTQQAPATIKVSRNQATIETAAWGLHVNLNLVTEIVCERNFIHHPEPYVLLWVSFRKGPDIDDVFPDELFTVMFDEAREADFRALCERHGLRKGRGW